MKDTHFIIMPADTLQRNLNAQSSVSWEINFNKFRLQNQPQINITITHSTVTCLSGVVVLLSNKTPSPFS